MTDRSDVAGDEPETDTFLVETPAQLNALAEHLRQSLL